jgi:hypothetical protein
MIDLANASYAGIVAGGVMAMLFVVGRAGGLVANSEMMLGTILVGRSPALAWATGAGISIATSILVGLMYAVGFEHVIHTTGPLAGIGLAAVHTTVSGLALAVLPRVHPLMKIQLFSKPGIFKSNLGVRDASAFVLLHLVFGAIVGLLYDPATAVTVSAGR